MIDQLKHKTGKGETIAYAKVEGNGPTLVWLGGFRSDMQGTKADFLSKMAKQKGLSFLRFDYFGHGASSGDFEQGSISQWLADAIEVIDILTQGPLILIGSSMGGWISLLSALARPDRVQALVLIAPAPDFTRTLMWAGFDAVIRQTITETGRWMQPSPYGPVPITRALIEDGDQHLILGKSICFDGPVRIFQGMNDRDVPWQHAQKLMNAITSTDIIFSVSKSGDHSLSSPADLARLQTALLELVTKK